LLGDPHFTTFFGKKMDCQVPYGILLFQSSDKQTDGTTRWLTINGYHKATTRNPKIYVNEAVEIALSDLGIIKGTTTGTLTFTPNGATSAITWSKLTTINNKYQLLAGDVSVKRTGASNTYSITIGDLDVTVTITHRSWSSNPLWDIEIQAPVDADDQGICVTGKCASGTLATSPPTPATEFTGQTTLDAATKACAPLLNTPDYNDCLFDVQLTDDAQVGADLVKTTQQENKPAGKK
jgi:hypothetical protein